MLDLWTLIMCFTSLMSPTISSSIRSLRTRFFYQSVSYSNTFAVQPSSIQCRKKKCIDYLDVISMHMSAKSAGNNKIGKKKGQRRSSHSINVKKKSHAQTDKSYIINSSKSLDSVIKTNNIDSDVNNEKNDNFENEIKYLRKNKAPKKIIQYLFSSLNDDTKEMNDINSVMMNRNVFVMRTLMRMNRIDLLPEIFGFWEEFVDKELENIRKLDLVNSDIISKHQLNKLHYLVSNVLSVVKIYSRAEKSKLAKNAAYKIGVSTDTTVKTDANILQLCEQHSITVNSNATLMTAANVENFTPIEIAMFAELAQGFTKTESFSEGKSF